MQQEMTAHRADERKAVVLEHALRRDVRDRGPRLQPVQSEVSKGVGARLGDGTRRQATTRARLVDEVADHRALHRAVDDAGDRREPCDLSAVEAAFV